MTDYTALAEKLYPNTDNDSWFCFSDYIPIIAHFGQVVLQVTDDGYSGDTRILYKDTDSGFGYLNIGWGSCCGCDALQSSHTYEELGQLIQTIGAQIVWMSRVDLLKFFREHDWEGDYLWDSSKQTEFVESAIRHLIS